jgi:DNA-binding NarL/FixJ family response regulator
MTPQPPVRVLIADDHLLFVEALDLTLGADKRVEVVGHAADGQSAVEQAGSLHPDVILMDLDMPVIDGIEATRTVRRDVPDCRIAVLTGSLLPEDALRARAAGAAAYLTKGCSAHDLLEAVLELGYCNLAQESHTESEVVAQT